ncbi:MAG: hypothetical protein QF578_18455 [Alphaproteobacteria bacterium]|jgi:hypothetical protein|nr:hypothetical protein [Alphaproteobacteria bacterium]
MTADDADLAHTARDYVDRHGDKALLFMLDDCDGGVWDYDDGSAKSLLVRLIGSLIRLRNDRP